MNEITLNYIAGMLVGLNILSFFNLRLTGLSIVQQSAIRVALTLANIVVILLLTRQS